MNIVKYIVLDWQTYLSDPEYWQKISNEKAIALHISSPEIDED